MFANFKARQMHQRLMRAAHHLLREAFHSANRTPEDVTPADFAAYAFGRYCIDVSTDDARDYLNAARVSRGEPISPAA